MKLLYRTSKWEEVVTDEIRQQNAMNVKNIWRWSSLFENMYQYERSTLRFIKRRYPKRYHQFRKLFSESSLSVHDL